MHSKIINMHFVYFNKIHKRQCGLFQVPKLLILNFIETRRFFCYATQMHHRINLFFCFSLLLSCVSKNIDSKELSYSKKLLDPVRDSTTSSGIIYGVTIDSIDNLAETVSSLKSMSAKPTVRIVFDENKDASYYMDAVSQIHAVSFVMGELLDSYYVKNYSTAAYGARTSEYLNMLGSNVDIWEIGNEINGEWLGDTMTVVAKMKSTYDLVKAKGKAAALTLYYNEGCWQNKSNEMFTWTQNNVPANMKQDLDYVWVSYYEDDCNNLQPVWPQVFEKLATMFPNSKIGFGEVGTKYADRKAAYINRYYRMKINHPNYVGGYFWWYFRQDMVPFTKPLWSVLNSAMQAIQ